MLERDRPKVKRVEHQHEPMSYLHLFRYATFSDLFLIFIAVLFAILCGSFQPYMLWLYGNVTDDIINYVKKLNNGTEYEKHMLDDELFKSGRVFASYTSVLGVITIIFTYFSGVLLSHCARKQVMSIRKLYVLRLINQDIEWYDENKASEYASTFMINMARFQEGIGEKISVFIFYESTFAFGVGAAFIMGWKFAFVCLVALPLSIVFMSIINWISSQFTVDELEAYSTADTVAREVVSLIKTVLAFEGQQKEYDLYHNYCVYTKNNNVRKGFFKALNNCFMWFFIYGGYALSFYYGISLILEYRNKPEHEQVYTPGRIVAIFSCALIATWNFGMGLPILQIFKIAKRATAKIFYIIDFEPIINRSKYAGVIPQVFQGSILFHNVEFGYPSRIDDPVLDNINMTIRSGETVAIVGESGSGKSTIINLIQRFYDVTSGSIYIGEHDIRELHLGLLREKIGYVDRDPVIFDITVSENISLGKTNATQQEIESAAKRAHIHEFICSLPQEYDTIINEKSEHLSLAQKQKIAIARALLKKPYILLLDEATSSLDSKSEDEIKKILDDLSDECTTIIVTQRPSIVKNVSRIIVMARGRVVEDGTHPDLMAAEGAYYHLMIAKGSNEKKDLDSGEDFDTVDISGEFIDPKYLAHQSEPEDTRIYEHESWCKYFREIMSLNKREWPALLTGGISSIVTGATPPLWAIIYGSFIGVLADQSESVIIEKTNMYCLQFTVMGAIAAFATFLQIYTFSVADENLVLRVRGLLFQAYLRQEIGWYEEEENNVDNLCTKLSLEADQVKGASGSCIGTALNFLTTFILSTILAILIQWELALVLVAFSPLILLFIWCEQNVIKMDAESSFNVIEKSTKITLEAVNNIKTVASLGCEQIFCDKWAEEIRPDEKLTKHKAHLNSIILSLSRSLMNFAYAAAIILSIGLILKADAEYGDTYKVSEAVIFGSWSIGTAFAFLPNFQEGLAAARSILAILHRVPKVKNLAYATDKPWDFGNIKFSHVEFAYPSKPNIKVLNCLDISIFQGKSVGIVGPSGSGKSTFLRLLQRFYDPTSGQISVDKKDIRLVSMESLRSQIGVVSPDMHLFNRSIAENIAYGANDKNVTIHEIMDAAKKANVHLFIKSFPLGYDTIIGVKGCLLSDGQKQRIAIARALVRNPKILLLDEATLYLDNRNGKIIEETLKTSTKLRTCITVTHRPTTVKDADLIYVIKEGRIIEYGKHDELMKKRGFYYKMFKKQTKPISPNANHYLI